MTATSPKRLSAPERRARILEAAANLMADRGYDRITVAEIADAAECSKPVLYDHFKSKGEIAVAVVEEANMRLLAHVAGAVGELRDQSERVRFEAGMNAFFEFVEQNRTVCRTLFRDPSADPVVFDVHTRVKHTAAQGVAAMLAEGLEPLPGDTRLDVMLELFGEMLTSALAGLALWWESHPTAPREDLVTAAVSFSFLGLERLAQGERLES
jgi:AcrR family transcriptional regulator